MKTPKKKLEYMRRYRKDNPEKIKEWEKKSQNRPEYKEKKRRYMKEYMEKDRRKKGIKIRQQSIKRHFFKWRIERKCAFCGNVYLPNRINQKYCSVKCGERIFKWKMRFQIFQKDNFTCQYCGRKPPECILEIDHKYPKSKGGLDKRENYITSCRECNGGKGDILLKSQEID